MDKSSSLEMEDRRVEGNVMSGDWDQRSFHHNDDDESDDDSCASGSFSSSHEEQRSSRYGDINLDEHPYSSSYVGMSAAANSVQQLALRQHQSGDIQENPPNSFWDALCSFLKKNHDSSSGIYSGRNASKSRRYRTMLISLCIVQFLIWFKPSEQYLFNVVPGWFGITMDDLLRNVYAHSLYAPFVLFPLVAIVFDKLGYKWAISICVFGSFATVALVIFGQPVTALLYLSEWTWALHFSAMFVVVATLYSLFPISWYMTIASANSGSMLVASLSSSLTGFFISKIGDSCTAEKKPNGKYFLYNAGIYLSRNAVLDILVVFEKVVG
eukprot:gb/GECG01005145.1/.p1 GENE.gb/GECG01005145.1/~~gb/GECG01005145.1/.p1  ORF type:complete len:326 (+),score=38.90 gb/GECG01005145.1/:1-978(+)